MIIHDRNEDIHDIEASLLGRMCNPMEFFNTWSACDELGLSGDAFAHDCHRHFFHEMDRLRYSLGKPRPGHQPIQTPTEIVILEWLISRGTAELCGGLQYVSALNLRDCGAVKHTIRRIRDHAARREAAAVLKAAQAAIWDGQQTVDDLVVGTVASLNSISASATHAEVKNGSTIAGAMLYSTNNPTRKQRVSSGIPELDDVLSGGMRPRRLYLVAGRPSHGKTALALHLLVAGVQQGHAAFFLSLEMKATYTEDLDDGDTGEIVEEERAADLTTRLFAMVSGVPVDAITAMQDPEVAYPYGRHEEDDRRLINAAAYEIAQWPLEIDDEPGLTWAEAEARIRRAKARNPALKIVALDYIGLVRPKRGQDFKAMLEEAAVGMSDLANELGVVFLCLCQLNRACEERGDKRPVASDLRYSGKLEQAAASILFVQRPCKYEAWERHNTAFWVAEGKGRFTEKSSTVIEFDGPTQRIYGPSIPDPVKAEADTGNRGGGHATGSDW